MVTRLDRLVAGSITGVAARNALLQAKHLGVDVTPLLKDLKVSALEALNSEQHIPAASYLALWGDLANMSPDPCLPVRAGLGFDFDSLELYGFLTRSAATVAQAYEYGARYRELYNVGSSWELEPRGNEIALEWHSWNVPDATPDARSAANEYQLAEMLSAVGHLIGKPYVPALVCFQHAARTGTEGYTELLGCPVEYSARFDGFIGSSEVLNYALPQSNSALLRYLTKQSEEILAQRRAPETHSENVRAYLLRFMAKPRSELSMLPSQSDVARALGLSQRSLHRKLEQEGFRYSELLDGVREETATESLKRPSLAIGEIAYLLGFNDPSAFFKAFKRWTGISPSEYRTTLGAPRC